MRPDAKRVSISAGSLAYVDTGEGPPVLMLHGFPTSSKLWRREMMLLGSRMRVIAPDLLGHGDSDKPAQADLSVSAQALYVRELLDTLGIAQMAVIGHELGGGIAQLLALEGLVKTMVLVDSVAFDAWPGEHIAELQAVPQRHRSEQTMDRFIRSFVDRGISRAGRRDPAIAEMYLEPWRGDPSAFFRAAAALDGHGLPEPEGLAGLDLPTFILWGEDDPFVASDVGERLGDAIPGSMVALLPGCSHLVHEEAPETVDPLIYQFLRLRYLGESHGGEESEPVRVYLERPPHG